ncbi:hypothetical protein ACWDA3_30630 [Nonomuraea rubra]
MSFDLVYPAVSVLIAALFVGLPVSTATAAIPVRRLSAPPNRAAFRWFCASRAGLSTLCGTVLGAVAGCPAGLLLLWPLTMRTTWEAPARVPFETPWPAIVAVVAGLPLLAAALGALFAREVQPVHLAGRDERSWSRPAR